MSTNPRNKISMMRKPNEQMTGENTQTLWKMDLPISNTRSLGFKIGLPYFHICQPKKILEKKSILFQMI